MRDIVLIVESGIHNNDGYKTRIEMEIEILESLYNCHILIPCGNREKIPEFMHSINIIKYDSYRGEIPFIFNWRKLRRALRKFLDKHPNAIVVGEAHISALMAYRVAKEKNCKFIFDCHGTEPEEVYLCNHNFVGFIYSKWLKGQERKILKNSDLIITVSNCQYAKWKIQKAHALLPMIPSDIFFEKESHRSEVRDELSILPEDTVYVYSGQDQIWQCLEKNLDFYKKLETDNTFLLIYTHDIKSAESKIKNSKIKRYAIKEVMYNQMPRYLDAADFGFCIRENNIINKVASPTKVLEYLVRNVKPILSEYVGDYSEELPKLRLGHVIKDLHINDELSKIRNNAGFEYVKRYKEHCVFEYLEKLRDL